MLCWVDKNTSHNNEAVVPQLIKIWACLPSHHFLLQLATEMKIWLQRHQISGSSNNSSILRETSNLVVGLPGGLVEVVALFEHLCLAADFMVFYQQSMAVESSYLLFLLAFPFSPSKPTNVRNENVRLRGFDLEMLGLKRYKSCIIQRIAINMCVNLSLSDSNSICSIYNINTLES